MIGAQIAGFFGSVIPTILWTVWTVVSGSTNATANGVAGTLNDKLVIAGGSGGGSNTKILDPVTGYSAGTNYPFSGQGMRAIGDNSVLIGVAGDGASSAVYYTSNATGSWSTGTTYPRNVTNAVGCWGPKVNGKFIYVGGADVPSGYNAIADVYSCTTAGGSWSTETSYPYVIRSTRGTSQNGNVYVIGGVGPGFQSAVYYYAGTGAWTAATSVPFPTADGGVAPYGATGLVASTSTNSSQTNYQLYKWNGSTWSATTKQGNMTSADLYSYIMPVNTLGNYYVAVPITNGTYNCEVISQAELT
jgi:hypothetical protein